MKKVLIAALAALSWQANFTSDAKAEVDISLLKQGTFVSARASCSGASNSTIMRFDGRTFTAGRFCPASVGDQHGSSLTIRRDCPGEYDRGSVQTDTFKIKSPLEFVWSNELGSSTYRYCEQSALPEIWRDVRVAQTASGTHANTLQPAICSIVRETRAEIVPLQAKRENETNPLRVGELRDQIQNATARGFQKLNSMLSPFSAFEGTVISIGDRGFGSFDLHVSLNCPQANVTVNMFFSPDKVGSPEFLSSLPRFRTTLTMLSPKDRIEFSGSFRPLTNISMFDELAILGFLANPMSFRVQIDELKRK